jgi:PadR family transcriptional regulator AphA
MSSPKKIPALGYALLGLLNGKPASGYDLRKIFSSTSMKSYSDSPGAIYPALGRLQKQGLIRGTIEAGTGMRRRQVFRVTAKGLAELKKWIARPVNRDDIVRGPQEVMLRFAFSEMVVGSAAAIELLRSLAGELEGYVASLNEELKAMPAMMPTSGRLAFECGVRGNQGLLEWTRYALTTYERKQGGKS